VIGGQGQHDALRISLLDRQSSEANTGTRSSAHGFAHDVFIWNLGKLLLHQGNIFGCCDDVYICYGDERKYSIHGLLEHRAFSKQV